MTVKDKKTGKDSHSIKTSKNKKGELRTEIIIAAYTVVQNNQVVGTGMTDAKGKFKVWNLQKGSCEIRIVVDQFLKSDTLFQLNRKRSKVDISLDDRYLWRHIDSIQLAKFPYNREIAREDIERGDVKILSFGLQILSGDDLDSVTSKYGFRYLPVAGCVIGGYEQKAIVQSRKKNER